ncbi:Phage phi-r73 primase-like protein [Mannheimia varigena USDA-ARS-USMARC-1296]|uniref:Phage phi-r73 primase-like protein n=1 Tax=Mannheimia varigena USDA-ARS-USMARC-1296 TaxID=1433287 RepID=W0QCR9_9PAST|nr:DUF5906 domain-containing protein [Mannheimia varigena]AHG76321.1 Phage phi-r73 primase-like protein [Mannheimia varigena USDA-ARS-USMARC-1296]
MSKPQNAPNVSKQPKGKPYEAYIIAGSNAWDKTKQQTVLEWTKAEPNYQPIILGSKQLQEIDRLKLAVEVGNVAIYRAGTLTEAEKSAICQNLAKHSTAETVAFYDEALQLEENASEYIARLREDLPSGGSAEPKDEYEERFNTLGDNGKVAEFLKWYAKPLQRHAQSREFYQYNGKKWEILERDLLGREIRNFFIAKGIKKYSAIRIKKMIDLFEYELEPTAKHNPYILAFNNGILDKRSLEFKPHTATAFITSFINADYSEDKQPTPNFDKWLKFVSNGSLERARTILAGLFMVLTNADKWQLFIEVTGAGGTGKSTYTEIAKLLAGENNHVGITLKALDDEVKRCIIIDKTFIISGEQPKYTGNGATIRAITGGDDVFFNPKHKKPFSQKVNAVFMTTNNSPIIFTENSGGTERRRVIFRFDKVVPIEERDFNLLDKIQAETGGIIRLLFDTFPNPLEAKALLEKQRVSQEALAVKMEVNHVLEFALEFEVMPVMNGLSMGSNLTDGSNRDNAIYPAYIYYCQLNDIEPINRRTFTRAFKQALRELDKGEYQTRESNGRTITNIKFIDKNQTFNKWRG